MIVCRAMRGAPHEACLPYVPCSGPITVYFLNGGLLDYPQQMAAHERAPPRNSTIAGMTQSDAINRNITS
jgi:hypothetical protein